MAKEFVFRYPHDHEASSSSSSTTSNGSPPLDLELSLAPPGSRNYVRSSSSSEDGGDVLPISVGNGGFGSVGLNNEVVVVGNGGFGLNNEGVVGNGGFGLNNEGVVVGNGGFGLNNEVGVVGGGVIPNPNLGVVVAPEVNGAARPPFHGGGGVFLPINGGSRRQTRLRPPSAENTIDVAVPPFEWATRSFAKIHQKDHLLQRGIHTISGEVQCKKCDYRLTLEFDLQSKLIEVGTFIFHNKDDLCHRAADNWTSPKLETCPSCEQKNALKPIIPSDKGKINWLFLLLGQMIGCCTLEQLKYFCDKNRLHRTGAKDRLVFLAYLSLCEQLDPTGPFKLDGCYY